MRFKIAEVSLSISHRNLGNLSLTTEFQTQI